MRALCKPLHRCTKNDWFVSWLNKLLHQTLSSLKASGYPRAWTNCSLPHSFSLYILENCTSEVITSRYNNCCLMWELHKTSFFLSILRRWRVYCQLKYNNYSLVFHHIALTHDILASTNKDLLNQAEIWKVIRWQAAEGFAECKTSGSPGWR